MNERKYAFIFYWGEFGHGNSNEQIMKVNDLINSFDWLNVKKNEAYPVFSDASTNDPLPWPSHNYSKKPGQINAFFRWKTLDDSARKLEVSLFLVGPADLKTSFAIPSEATANVSLRRLQNLRIAPGETIHWTFGAAKGAVKADERGCVTVPQVKITAQPVTLCVHK